MRPAQLRAYQRSMYAGNPRHGRTEPKGYNAHFQREKRKRKRQRRQADPEPKTREEHVKRALRSANGHAPGHPKTEDERTLADLCGRWVLHTLDVDPDAVNAKWGGPAAELDAWGHYVPSTGEVKLAENHPDLLSMLWTTIHECVHAKDAQKGELVPAWKRSEDETDRIEKETDERTADLLDEFLAWLDTPKMREAGISGLTFDDLFPHTEPIPA